MRTQWPGGSMSHIIEIATFYIVVIYLRVNMIIASYVALRDGENNN